MFRKNRAPAYRTGRPNYLKPICLVLAAIFLLFLFLNIFLATRITQDKNREAAVLPNRPKSNFVSKNLITLIQNDLAKKPRLKNTSPVLGKSNAPITIFEYSSFSCAYSAQVQKIIKDILAKYPNKVKLVWKDMPTGGGNIITAHEAARCAQKQNKFWQYYDGLWLLNRNFNFDNLKKIAKDIGLNEGQFESCLKNRDTLNLINDDLKEVDDLAIPGSPHFYINQQEFMGLIDFADFENAIETELNRTTLNFKINHF
ncbi:thioredoxin domain-containing protein [Candidatus Falkowbacteria bacterium]|nr:thioredoxin domain-containing protein [Candidatus Falkowbacteria bacterium]